MPHSFQCFHLSCKQWTFIELLFYCICETQIQGIGSSLGFLKSSLEAERNAEAARDCWIWAAFHGRNGLTRDTKISGKRCSRTKTKTASWSRFHLVLLQWSLHKTCLYWFVSRCYDHRLGGDKMGRMKTEAGTGGRGWRSDPWGR